MGSKLEVDSVYGEGSKFSFTIKQPIIDPEPVGNLEKRIRENAAELDYSVSFIVPDAKLLVVDDNAMNRLVFAELLRDMECSIDEADSGPKCLEMVQKEKYDIIFMDHMMPGMDGLETLERMRGFGDYINAKTPVIALTANAISGAKEMFMEAGFDDYLSKPIVPEKLERLLGNMLHDKKKPAPRQANEKKIFDDTNIDVTPVEGIDWDYTIKRMGSLDRSRDMVKGFIINAGRELDVLMAIYEMYAKSDTESNATDLANKAMNLNHFALDIGALYIASLAKLIADWAKGGNRQDVASLMRVFPREWKKQIALLEKVFGDSSNHDY